MRVVAHRTPAVVDQDDVQLLRAMHADLERQLDVGRTRGAGDELRVGADLLARRAARQELQDRHRIVE